MVYPACMGKMPVIPGGGWRSRIASLFNAGDTLIRLRLSGPSEIESCTLRVRRVQWSKGCYTRQYALLSTTNPSANTRYWLKIDRTDLLINLLLLAK